MGSSLIRCDHHTATWNFIPAGVSGKRQMEADVQDKAFIWSKYTILGCKLVSDPVQHEFNHLLFFGFIMRFVYHSLPGFVGQLLRWNALS